MTGLVHVGGNSSPVFHGQSQPVVGGKQAKDFRRAVLAQQLRRRSWCPILMEPGPQKGRDGPLIHDFIEEEGMAL